MVTLIIGQDAQVRLHSMIFICSIACAPVSVVFAKVSVWHIFGQEWEKGCVLWKLVRLRNSLFEKGLQREADYDDMYRLLQSQLSQVQESHTSLSEKIVQTEVDYEDQIFKRYPHFFE